MLISDVSIDRPVFTTMVILAILVFGAIAFGGIGVDLMPNTDLPYVTVTTIYRGASPETVETKVTKKIEDAVNTIEGVKTLRSASFTNGSQVVIEFRIERKADAAIQDVRDKVSAILSDLPEEIESPIIQKLDINAAPICAVAVSGALPMRDLTYYADEILKPRLNKLEGVGSIELTGGRKRQIRIWLNSTSLLRYALSPEDVTAALQTGNLEMPGGKVETGSREFPISVKGEFTTTAEVEALVVKYTHGAPIRVRDLARVEDGLEDEETWSSLNGTTAVALSVKKQSGANTVQVSRLIKQELEAVRKELPAGMDVRFAYDNAPFIENSINEVKHHLLLGGGLAVIIVLLFLRDLKSTLISAVALPTSVVGTFMFMKWLGFTFNNLTMLGLTISIGMLIDDAIVVLENIHRHVAEGMPPIKAARFATSEIGLAVLATTFSIVAVFVPVAFMQGIIGKIFYEFAMTVNFAVLISLLVSFTMTPMLCAYFLRKEEGHGSAFSRGMGRLLDAVDRLYLVFLDLALRRRWATVAVAVLCLVASFGVVSRVKMEFRPDEDKSLLSVSVKTPLGGTIAETRAILRTAEVLLSAMPETVDLFSVVGSGTQKKANEGSILVKTVPRSARDCDMKTLMGRVRDRLAGLDLPGVTFKVGEADTMGTGGIMSTPLQFQLLGVDLAELRATAKRCMEALRKIPGIVDVDSSSEAGKPELWIEVDRLKAAALDVNVYKIANILRILYSGQKVTTLKDGGLEHDIHVKIEDAERRDEGVIRSLVAFNKDKGPVDFSNVVTIRRGEGPTQIDRFNRMRNVTIGANLNNLPLGEAVDAVNAYLAREPLPPGVTAKFSGQSDMMKESFANLFFAMGLAVVAVYMILASQFDSFVHPFTIMLSLPFSLIGAFLLLVGSGKTLSMMTMIGLIMLFGLVTKNAILLIDYTNTLRAAGLPTLEALRKAGPVRLRPILMTTFAMIFGMLPVALGLGEGSEMRAPMAIVVIGGLVTSTVLTLVIIPVVYSLLDDLLNWSLLKRMNAALVNRE